MATATHLDGFFRTDEDNLALRITNAFAESPATDRNSPWVANVYFKDQYGGKMEKVNQRGELVCKTPTAHAVDAFVDDIEAALTNRKGDDPYGYLRVKVYKAGNSGKPEIDMSRMIAPGEMGSQGDPNMNLLNAELAHLRARNAMLEDNLTTGYVALVDQNANLTKALTDSATVRTATSASSDLSSIAAIVGLGVLVVAKPAIMRFFNLPPDATADQVGIALRRFMLGLQDGYGKNGGNNGSNGGGFTLDDVKDPPLIDEAAPDLSAELQGKQPAEVLEAIESDPELLKGILGLAASRPDLMQLAMTATPPAPTGGPETAK